ncbi:hypothetical protein JGH11_10575 [Dysgonomonas sp. Marseille-P4677]|uniref:hypothetical protein n=1 Tax=Dysgonomonas sp. Marseille-P4677 TaxID=2364790 RepID=UPI0019134736|nr:hypothetical protein [Dysgonomonas sp. Marseille-P4677]MBK5721316.1 hypothetical protein [Dysgonomonas sp. Marseille-P4677]
MMMTTQLTTEPESKTTKVCLSDYGLSPRMTISEVIAAVEKLKNSIGEKKFRPTAKTVYHNLNQMNPGTSFDWMKFFTGYKIEVFLVVAHRYIVEHMNYEFSNDYSTIRRIF